MRLRPSILLATGLLAALAVPAPLSADLSTGTLDVYWVDSEGGGSTLLVTPAGESVLIDSGFPAVAGRIVKAARECGLKSIDFAIVTHFHIDHFGGVPVIAPEIPIGQLWDNGIPDADPDHNPDLGFWRAVSAPYRKLAIAHHQVSPGDLVPLRQRPESPRLSMRCLGSRQRFVDAPAGAPENPLTSQVTQHETDTTDNANSNVWVVDFGPFRMFDGGDLTWNMEGRLVTPVNRVGQVDVYQVDHHGLGLSNNPVLIHSLAPTVAVMNNGPTKGTARTTLEGLRSSPGIQAIYQVHRNVRPGEAANNTADEFIANTAADSKSCPGNLIKMAVAPDGKSYTITIPARGLSRTFQTRLDKPGA